MAFERFKNLSGRTKLIIVLVILLLIVLLAYYIWSRLYAPVPVENVRDIRQEQPAGQTGTLPTVSRTNNAGILADIVETQPVPTAAPATDTAATLFAASFAERFGSYSNQGNFENLDELKVLMTDSVQRWVDTYKQQLRARHGFNTYYGIETKGLSTTVTAEDAAAGTATVVVQTQRQEFVGVDAAPRLFYQNIRLELVKQGTDWKVNGVYWE